MAAALELKQAARKQIKEALKRLTPDAMGTESKPACRDASIFWMLA